MKAIRWWDKQSVHVLATGGSSKQDRIVRHDPLTGEKAEVMAPRVVKDYQTIMGGVDVHDQLRLQRYSLQLALRYKKYYKSLFLGLIDLVIINAYIVFNYHQVHEGNPKMPQVQFLKQLHLELCQLQPEDWRQLLRHRGLQPTPTKARKANAKHVPIQTDEWRVGGANQARKRRQRACKLECFSSTR
ncbi:Pol protein [Phytophthora cinnamomi]|uniref:Pol protein n=1 Tax=Phytophthora cinnamomi TaxID=4785 RepID=UPI0035594EBA|nr:Pol protein [Phytophthora cinnamomi]